MSVILEQLAQILAKAGISSSQEEEILTAAQSLNTPPETNEESTSEELEEDNEELQHDLSEGNYAYEIYIERWFQATTRLDSFNFSFYFVNLQLQQLDSFILVKFYFSFEKLPLNILLLLLHAWLHWLFDYT
jgi:hypothetical protein